ncbi:BAR-domain-containing protein [Epithele typhae]|uniref:BAR-domain-containing protein n=1 Tax=Epithele typhae TaxID=378194 RepID=UPI002007DBD4|nr:BAR-domain-containing protein [Epithele typhae]KAH9929508.1 BAR-domain-containing protein [Epithele typhae]
MSWTGFKKGISRAGTTIMQKTGQIERTVDREFVDEETKYKTFEKECQTLQKAAKGYSDAMKAMTGTQGRLADTIDVFYRSPLPHDHHGPLGKMNAIFPVVNEQIGKRNKKLLDYDSARSRMNKLIQKPSDDPTKLPRAQQEHDETKEVFDLLNEQLISELPQLLDLRIPYFDPSFEAMIRMQCKFAEEGYEKLGGVQRYFADQVRDDYAAGQLDAQVEGILQEMRELTICGAS